MMQISELTYEIDDDSAIAEAAGRVTEEGVAGGLSIHTGMTGGTMTRALPVSM
jgi:hypothetical protein